MVAKGVALRHALIWKGRTVVLVGGGPSASDVVSVLREWKDRSFIIVAVNDSVKLLPEADVVFTADGRWLKGRQEILANFAGERVAALPSMFRVPGAVRPITVLYRLERAAISRNPLCLYYAGNSGFGALMLAVQRGAKRIVLAGYDMNGPGHWHGGYDWPCRFGVNEYPEWAQSFERISSRIAERNIDVVNLNPDSAVRCFRFASLDEALS